VKRGLRFINISRKWAYAMNGCKSCAKHALRQIG